MLVCITRTGRYMHFTAQQLTHHIYYFYLCSNSPLHIHEIISITTFISLYQEGTRNLVLENTYEHVNYYSFPQIMS